MQCLVFPDWSGVVLVSAPTASTCRWRRCSWHSHLMEEGVEVDGFCVPPVKSLKDVAQAMNRGHFSEVQQACGPGTRLDLQPGFQLQGHCEQGPPVRGP